MIWRMKICAIDDCCTPAAAKGWCGKHYQRWVRHGDPLWTPKKNETGRCTVDGCERPSRNGTSPHCELHYSRIKRHGDPTVVLTDHTPAVERWKTSYVIDPQTGCWNWTGPIYKGQGHGFIQDGAKNRYMAHRYVWERLVGPIDAGLVLDHLCKNKRCVNPTHLEAVTQAVNAFRGGADGGNASKTECIAGHEYTPENTYRDPKNGWRQCRTCMRARMREKKYRYAYVYLWRPDHPIAGRSGTVMEHRMVLYDAIGPGPHPCHWGCGTELDWGGRNGILVDHLNGDPGDNRLENLVPSCHRCNTSRAASGNLLDWRPPGTS